MGMWDAYAKRKLRELDALGRRALHPLDADPDAKKQFGTAVDAAGAVVGAGRGVAHDVGSLVDGAALAADLLSFGSPRQDAAVQAVTNGVKGAVSYVRSRAVDPKLRRNDASAYGDRLNKDLNPGDADGRQFLG